MEQCWLHKQQNGMVQEMALGSASLSWLVFLYCGLLSFKGSLDSNLEWQLSVFWLINWTGA